MHHRLAPKEYRFKHRVFLMSLDLDELPQLDHQLRWFGVNRPNFYSFWNSDHLQLNAAQNVRSNLTAWLATQGVALPPDTRIQLITLPRVFGYVFNPVSFYFCLAADGKPLCAVAEVRNTFGELKPYWVPRWPETAKTGATNATFRRLVPKEFYVSPFSDLTVSFDFRFRTPGEQLSLRVNDVAKGQTVLRTTLAGTRRELTDAELVRLTLRYPLVTLRVIMLIHWHALRLWLRRVPWFAKADNPHLQQGVLRPHASLASHNTTRSNPSL
jgi:DUF1365 family protein